MLEPDHEPYRVVLARGAKLDLAAIGKWSIRKFGLRSADRYATLINQALEDIGRNPAMAGAKSHATSPIRGMATYHISLSRARVSGRTVKEPRHILVYRAKDHTTIELLRILNDSRDLERHVPLD